VIVRLILLPAKVGVKSTTLAAKTGYRTGRLLGYRRLLVLGVGVGIGLLVAPMTGRQLREKLREAFESRTARLPDAELADRVRTELRNAPSTWHLPQPVVTVAEGTVVLSGQVPHETGRADFERAASSVPGVGLVENQLMVTGTNGKS
jgi:hypothetical protein